MKAKLVLLLVIVVAVALSAAFVAAQRAPEIDAPSGDAERGEEIFRHGFESAPPCIGCHVIDGRAGRRGFSIGPNLFGISERAGERMEDITAEEYIRTSILEPGEFVVSGYRDIMYGSYAEHFGQQELDDLVAFLMLQ
jgi:mono/diheme cytochrome c family protein